MGVWGGGGWGFGGERCTCGLKCCTNQIVQGSINVIVTDTFPGSAGLRIVLDTAYVCSKYKPFQQLKPTYHG